jgi:hypothetical protein
MSDKQKIYNDIINLMISRCNNIQIVRIIARMLSDIDNIDIDEINKLAIQSAEDISKYGYSNINLNSIYNKK